MYWRISVIQYNEFQAVPRSRSTRLRNNDTSVTCNFFTANMVVEIEFPYHHDANSTGLLSIGYRVKGSEFHMGLQSSRLDVVLS